MKKNILTLFSLFTAIIAFVCIVAFAEEPAQTTNNLPSLDHILERYVQAVGGSDALEKLTTRTCKVTAIHDLSWTDPQRREISIEAYAKVPGKCLIIEHSSTGDRREGYNGKSGWVRETDGPAREHADRNRKLLYFYDPQNALHLQEHFPELTVKGEKTLQGYPVYVVESATLDPLHYALYFDADTGLLRNIGTYWDIGDYREVDGVRLPHKIVCSRKGGSSTFIFDEVKHNLPLDDELFEMPSNARDR